MLKFGLPQILHPDNGTEVKSKLIEPHTTTWYEENLHIPLTPTSKQKIRIVT